MEYDFSSRVNRTNCGNIKAMLFTPPHIMEKGVVSYAGAEFEFKTARPVIDAVKAAAENGLFGFTVADDRYRNHVQWWLQEVRQTSIQPEWILAVQGTIFTVATCIRLFTQENDGVVILTPTYNRYAQAANRLHRKPVFVPMQEADGRDVIDMNMLDSVLAEDANKLLVLCNPNNPTGQMLRAPQLRAIAELAAKYDVAIVSDEIFADVVFGNEPVPVMSVAVQGSGAKVVSVVSMGKTFSFTGVNHANVIIPDDELRVRYEEQRNADHFGSIDPMAYAALCGGYTPDGHEWLKQMIRVIHHNNERIKSFFAEHMPAVTVREPDGTYVLWIDFSGLGLSAEELFRFLSDEAYFCCDPGEEYYGAPCMARLCTAVPPQEVERSLALLLEAAQKRGLAQ